MIKDYLKDLILHHFGHKPTNDQKKVIDSLCQFILTPDADSVFILRGFAGTGKTSLVSALVKTMEQLERECVLMAPTGRAAKVFSLYADHPSFTIHKRIYRQKSIDKDSIFTLNFNMRQNLLFICDEASMIANEAPLLSPQGGMSYGTGRLLDDLVHFVYGGKGCRLILMGDTAQLPPVGDDESPALSDEYMGGYGFHVISHTLTQVVRQANASGILWNATHLRQTLPSPSLYGGSSIFADRTTNEPRNRPLHLGGSLPQILFKGFPDVKNISGNDLIEVLEECYQRDGEDETIVVTRSNKRANLYNNGIRSRILWREEPLEGGDMLMVAKNNYYWVEKYNQTLPSPSLQGENSIPANEKTDEQGNRLSPQGETGKGSVMDFIANGDTAIIKRVRNERNFYGFTFVDATLEFPDFDNFQMELTVLTDTLQSEAPALNKEQQDTLYNNIMEDYAGDPTLRSKQDRLKALRQDPYYNALQIKYAYAVTCHKAQGGQWINVFIDQGYITEDMLTPEYFRWLYTAITRATTRVFFVNWPKEQVMEKMLEG
ncbi:MAG: AAA family ATPase [Bacteroidaceae bacterium]|nr:AAA family ATPase [Bacteroidaceae bacterium]